MKREEIIKMLQKHGEVHLEFTKADGTLRKMKGTRNHYVLKEILGESAKDSYKEEIDSKHNNVTVFDLEKNAFRSFKVDRLKSIVIK